jgi:hypothetical protein
MMQMSYVEKLWDFQGFLEFILQKKSKLVAYFYLFVRMFECDSSL